MQLVQMRVQYSFVMQLVQMASNSCRWGVEHSTIFTCYATCANEGWNTVKLCNLCKWGYDIHLLCNLCRWHRTRAGGTQYNIHLLCNLCKWGYDINLLCNLCIWHWTCADEGWNTVQLCNLCKWEVEGSTVMQLVQMRDKTQYNIHFVMQLVQMRVWY